RGIAKRAPGSEEMAMRLTPVGKIVGLLLVLGAAIGIWRLWGAGAADVMGRIAPGAKEKQSVVPGKGELPNVETDASGSSAPVPLPGSRPGCADKTEVRLLGYAWNAQMGILFAAGGPQATEGSLMCRHGVNFHFTRQDDNGKLQEALVAFATQLQQG